MRVFVQSMILSLIWVGQMTAQPLPVRSGDHSGFSRVTVPVSSATTWQIHRHGSEIRLNLTNHADGFDTQSVFTRMKRNRIVAIEPSKDRLVLRLGCNCTAAAFSNGGLLVLDIGDPNTLLAGKPVENKTPDPQRPVPPPLTERTATSRNPFLPWIGGGLRTTLQSAPPGTDLEAANPPIVALKQRSEMLSEMQEKLVTEIASASSLGLLTPDVKTNATGTSETDNTARQPAPTAGTLPQIQGAKPGNLRITSSLDPAPASEDETQKNVTTSGVKCLPREAMKVDEWTDGTDFSNQVSITRNALYDERDRLDPEAAVKLAKLYVHFGFGAEALNTLKLAKDLASENAGIAMIATILDRGHLPSPNPLAGFADCAAPVSLWAILGFRRVPETAQINADAAMRALNDLPPHLRRFLAPELSDRFLHFGDRTAAAAALRSIERLPEPPTPGAALAQVDLSLRSGSEARRTLEQVIATNSPQSPEALIKLVNQNLATDTQISQETAALVEAYAQELRGSEVGNRMREIQVYAFSQAAQFDAAFATLDALSPVISPTEARKMRESVLVNISRHGEDSAFLERIFEQDQAELAQMSVTARIELAQRLMDLGFADQVQGLIATIPIRPRNVSRQLLEAQAALNLNQPFRAIAALVEMDGLDATTLRAQAMEMAGNYAEASVQFKEIDAPRAAQRTAWMSDEWQTLIPADTTGLGALAKVASNPPQVSPEIITGPLARADAALAESESARTIIDALLRDPVVAVTADTSLAKSDQ